MEYKFIELTIQNLIELIDNERIDLNPSYQRNFIWSPNDQKRLIDTILKKYPLPNFFIFEKSDGLYEMVDGQQRSKTIYRFSRGNISSSKETSMVRFEDINKDDFMMYKLPVVLINKLSEKDSLRDFYVLINKKGVHLNPSEIIKSEYLETNFLKLANEVLDYQKLVDLNLFSETKAKRMNDRAFVEELLVYLKIGISEKKKAVEVTYEKDITQVQYNELRNEFISIIDIIWELNFIKHISLTRYKQINDFYTLFTFIHENMDSSIDILKYQYKILIILDGNDLEGKQFIRPSNYECDSLRSYAINCVSQSNSTLARKGRLMFFNAVLKNTNPDLNDTLSDVLRFLSSLYGPENVDINKMENYYLLDIEKLKIKY